MPIFNAELHLTLRYTVAKINQSYCPWARLHLALVKRLYYILARYTIAASLKNQTNQVLTELQARLHRSGL